MIKRRRFLAICIAVLMMIGSTNLDAFMLHTEAAGLEEEVESTLDTEEISESESIFENEEISESESIFENEEISESESIFENEEISESESIFENEETSESESTLESEEIPESESIAVSSEVSEDYQAEDASTMAIVGSVKLDEQHFPDAKFRAKIIEATSNKDNVLTKEEIEEIVALDVSKSSITDVKGVEYLTKLQYLDCSYNMIKQLDMSKNLDLSKLDCRDNFISELDYSDCSHLKYLDCSNNRLAYAIKDGFSQLTKDFYVDNNVYYLDTTELIIEKLFPKADASKFVFPKSKVEGYAGIYYIKDSSEPIEYTYEGSKFTLSVANPEVPVEKVGIVCEENEIHLYDGTYPLCTYVYPENATEKTLDYSMTGEAADYCHIVDNTIVIDSTTDLKGVITGTLKVMLDENNTIFSVYNVFLHPMVLPYPSNYVSYRIIFNGSEKTLADVELPAECGTNYEWKYPNTVISGYADSGVLFPIQRKKTTMQEGFNYPDVEVGIIFSGYQANNLNEMDFVTSPGRYTTTLAAQETGYLSIPTEFTNGTPENVTITAEVKETSKLGLTVQSSGNTSFSVMAGTTAGEIKLLVTVSIVKNSKVLKKYTKTLTGKVVGKIVKYDVKGPKDSIPYSKAMDSIVQIGDVYYLYPSVFDYCKEAKTEEDRFVVKLSNPKIVEVSEYSDPDRPTERCYKLEVKKEGLTTLTITSAANSKVFSTIHMRVWDNTPIFAEETLYMDKATKFGVSTKLYPVNNTEIVEISMDDDSVPKALKEVGLFITDLSNLTSDGSFLLQIPLTKTKQELKSIKGSYKINIKVRVRIPDTDETRTYTKPITLKITEKAPKSKIKCVQSMNQFFFETDPVTGKIVANNEIGNNWCFELSNNIDEYKEVTVGFAQEEQKDIFKYYDSWDETYHMLNYGFAENVENKYAISEIPKKLNICIKYNKYRDGYEQTIPVSAKIVNQKPKIRVELVKTDMYSQMKDTSARFRLYYDEEEIYSDCTVLDSQQANFTLERTNTFVLKNKTGKSGTAVICVKKNNWPTAVQVKIPVKVVNAVPVVTMNKTSLTLNNNKEFTGYEFAVSDISVRGGKDYKVKRAIITPADAKTKKNASALSVSYNDVTGKIEAQFSKEVKEGIVSIEKGTYTFLISPVVTYQNNKEIFSGNAKPVKLKITVTDKKPTIKVKTYGKLDILRRTSYFINYQSTVNGINGEIEYIELVGKDRIEFDSEYRTESKQLNVTLRESRYNYSVKNKYSVQLKITMRTQNGGVIVYSPTQSIKIQREAPKAGYNVIKSDYSKSQDPTIYVRSESSSRATYIQLIFDKPIDASISTIKVKTKTDAPIYAFAYGSSSLVGVRTSNEHVKAGTYTVPIEITFMDDDEAAAKPVKLNLKVVITD